MMWTILRVFVVFLSLSLSSLTFWVKSNSCTGLDWPLALLDFEAPQISSQLAHEGGKKVNLVLISVTGCVDLRAKMLG
jgi:hypothetical protein